MLARSAPGFKSPRRYDSLALDTTLYMPARQDSDSGDDQPKSRERWKIPLLRMRSKIWNWVSVPLFYYLCVVFAFWGGRKNSLPSLSYGVLSPPPSEPSVLQLDEGWRAGAGLELAGAARGPGGDRP